MSTPSNAPDAAPQESLDRDADRYLAKRALPGVVMGPAVMAAFVFVVGRGSPFWTTGVSFAAAGAILAIPRFVVTSRLRRLPDSASFGPWRRAFAATTLASSATFALFMGLGISLVGVDVTAAAMIFAAVALLAGTMNVFAANRRLMLSLAAVLYFIPVIGILAMDSGAKALFSVLATLQAGYAIALAKSTHAEYWELARARAGLTQRNGDMRRVLDNVEQGFLTMDSAGRLASERSATVDRWFGPYAEGTLFSDYVAAADAAFGGYFGLAHEAIHDGILPLDLWVAQLPERLVTGDREYRCSYVPLPSPDGRDGSLLVVINDVTEARRRERNELVQKELLGVAQGLMSDRAGYLAFYEEGKDLMAQLGLEGIERTLFTRLLHTLKGNAAMAGAEALAAQCHQAEGELAEEDEVSGPTLTQIHDRWSAISGAVSSLLGARSTGLLEVNQAAVERLVERVRAGASSSEVIAALDGWTLEPAEKALERLASYAVPLSRRLGKGELVTTVSAPEVRLDPRAWNGLWSVLVHVVRNALDHGIETPDVRAAHGKGQPRLRFSAREEDGRLLVEIADDGQGIDWERVAEKAAARGMAVATRKDLEAALLDPGFTTRDEISIISGRGVGMSAVAEEVKRLGGTMEVTTTPQLGTAWQFSLPMAA